jgi:hypothetical protein
VRSRLALALATLTIGAAGGAGVADAAVVAGSNLAQAPDSAFCVSDCTSVISTLPPVSRAPGGARAPTDGVVVAWAIRTGENEAQASVRLRVVRGNLGAGGGQLEKLPTGPGVYPYATRVPVRAGDLLGVDITGIPAGVSIRVFRETAEASFALWTPALGDGEVRLPTDGDFGNSQLLMNATIEPDADADAWGDETQDKCAGVPGPTEGCPSPRPPGGGGGPGGALAPNTQIKAGPKGRIAKRRASFRFRSPAAAVSFQCKIDRKPWKSCKSPRVYRGLSEGRHKFRVRAVGPTGLVDATPAKRSFRVEL